MTKPSPPRWPEGFPAAQVRVARPTDRLEDGGPCPAPSRDNLLVFYFEDRASIEGLAARLNAMGYPEVTPDNPYWAGKSITIEDPDGWRVVLCHGGFGSG